MSAYFDSLNPTQKSNAAILVQRMTDAGITNPYAQSAILSVISKESSFIPQNENLSYTAPRIQQVWRSIPSDVANKLANNPQALGDYVYGPSFNPSLGNGAGEGYKYRGRGYNEITGKSNYQRYGNKIGVDLISNPDALNDPKNAADAAIAFFKDGINALANSGKLQSYNATNINDFKNVNDSTAAMYHINSGVGKSVAQATVDTTGGRSKAFDRVGSLYDFVKNAAISGVNLVKKNPWITAGITAAAFISIYILIRSLKSK